jgi:hypothetical protein
MELEVIKNTLHNNKYNTHQIKEHHKSHEQNTDTETQHRTAKTKWATFTYSGKETRIITKLFKGTQIKIAYRTSNTIENIQINTKRAQSMK